MLGSRSPPAYKPLATGTGGSASASSLSSSSKLATSSSQGGHPYQQAYVGHSHACYHHQQQQQSHPHHSHGHGQGSRTSLTPTMKRGKKNWGSRERSSMSFLIVILFFAVFGLIILTEVSSRVGLKKRKNCSRRSVEDLKFLFYTGKGVLYDIFHSLGLREEDLEFLRKIRRIECFGSLTKVL